MKTTASKRPGSRVQPRSSDTALRGTRLLGAGMLAAAGTAHIPVIPSHLREAPYIGVLFILLTVACLGLAAILTWRARTPAYAAAAIITGAAIVAYVLSRTVGLPMIEDDIGNWFEPLGVISVVTEAAALLICADRILKIGTAQSQQEVEGRPRLLHGMRKLTVKQHQRSA